MTRHTTGWPGDFHVIDHRDETTVRWSYLRGSFDDDVELVVVSFRGRYRYGSGGNEDAPHLDAAVRGAHAFEPDAILLDLRELHYEWGDRMSDPLASAWVNSVPVTCIVGDLSREGLTSLFADEWMARPQDYLFETVDAAVSHAIGRVHAVRLAWKCAQSRTSFDENFDRIEAKVDEDGRDDNGFFRGLVIDDILRPGGWSTGSIARKLLTEEVRSAIAGAPDFAFRVSRLTEKLLRLEEAECVDFLCEIFAAVDDGDIDLVGLADEISLAARARIRHALNDPRLNTEGVVRLVGALDTE